MSKFRKVLGGLAGIGLLAALVVGGLAFGQTSSPHAVPAHVKISNSLTIQCLLCTGA